MLGLLSAPQSNLEVWLDFAAHLGCDTTKCMGGTGPYSHTHTSLFRSLSIPTLRRGWPGALLPRGEFPGHRPNSLTVRNGGGLCLVHYPPAVRAGQQKVLATLPCYTSALHFRFLINDLRTVAPKCSL